MCSSASTIGRPNEPAGEGVKHRSCRQESGGSAPGQESGASPQLSPKRLTGVTPSRVSGSVLDAANRRWKRSPREAEED
jgi:hypothetical protein